MHTQKTHSRSEPVQATTRITQPYKGNTLAVCLWLKTPGCCYPIPDADKLQQCCYVTYVHTHFTQAGYYTGIPGDRFQSPWWSMHTSLNPDLIFDRLTQHKYQTCLFDLEHTDLFSTQSAMSNALQPWSLLYPLYQWHKDVMALIRRRGGKLESCHCSELWLVDPSDESVPSPVTRQSIARNGGCQHQATHVSTANLK